ncbi:MAG: hypothetical protein P1P76_09910 [Anaerolineales bacterium]|nr:hypothetical protein [Anaerolineales bacterium]
MSPRFSQQIVEHPLIFFAQRAPKASRACNLMVDLIALLRRGANEEAVNRWSLIRR